MEYVALDLETTGLDPKWDRVIEVGAVAFTGDRVVDTLERLAHPGRSVPDQVLKLTGIDRQELAEASPWKEVLDRLAEFLRGRQPIGHGARVERGFLAAAGLWPDDLEILDTLDIARILLPDAASHSLPVLATEMGLDQPRPHRALDDADATRQLFLRLRQRAAGLDEGLKEKMLALIAPYGWSIASFFAEALADAPLEPAVRPAPRPRRPKRDGEGPRDDPRALASLLDATGPLARSMAGYEQREGQLQMLLAVAQIMRRGGTLVVEAGTGTGKSLAYLIPAVARAIAHGERVVVATHTHTLQEQLIAKDIPSLSEWLPWDFEACLLKGRGNYISLRRWRHYLVERCQDPEELCFKLKILVWLHQTETGDRSELRLHGREEVFWARIASDPLDCVGIHCRSSDCFVHRAREEAERADVVVVNHALLLADAATAGGLLPEFDHLIVDEAHHLEDAATQGLRTEVEGPGLVALLDRLQSQDGGRSIGLLPQMLSQGRLDASTEALAEAEQLVPRARSLVAELFSRAQEWARAQQRDEERREEGLRLTTALRERPDWQGLATLGADVSTGLAALETELRRAVSLSREWLGGEAPDQALRELEIIRGRLMEAGQLIREAFTVPDANRVYWFSLARTGTLALRSAPVEVGSLLHEQVFADRRSVVLTSASLAVAGSFDFFCQRSGVGAGAETLIVPSPFDYLRQALVAVPIDVPDPGEDEFNVDLSSVVADVARRLGGRTLALFTSHQQLRDVYDMLKQRGDLDQVLILGQGIDGQRRQVLKAFRETERALLLGTSSFWEGIDLPGSQLSCVIVVRLPFPVPSEPVYAARAERLRDPFAQYALPRAVLRLKQGFGRLIRRGDDRGAVVILDGRVLRRDYGRTFLDALPKASRFVGTAGEVAERVELWVRNAAG
jgi:predicted DnaQ family exonuclease/DinG family helicase